MRHLGVSGMLAPGLQQWATWATTWGRGVEERMGLGERLVGGPAADGANTLSCKETSR